MLYIPLRYNENRTDTQRNQWTKRTVEEEDFIYSWSATINVLNQIYKQTKTINLSYKSSSCDATNKCPNSVIKLI